MMISALNEGSPGAASECWMWRRICVGGKNGCSWDSRESGCERSITRRGIGAPFGRTNVRHHAILGPNDSGGPMEGVARVNGVDLWYEISGEGEPVVQIHGAGFGHFNFAPATPVLAER